ncbi:MAG: hypothetical protein WDN08_03365 [Rhizomicrobium sp.]
MIRRSLAVTAALFLACATAEAAPEASLTAAILACAAQQGDAAQLACYNGIAAQLKTAPIAAPSAPAAAGPAPQAAAPLPPAAPASTATVFGLPPAEAPADSVTARVANVTYNYFHVFTVTLDNGQVWRQVDSDGKVARFRNDKTEVVTISRGFLDSYHLAIQGGWGSFTVRRIK